MRLHYFLKQTGTLYVIFLIIFPGATLVDASLSSQDLRQTILILDRARTNGIVELQEARSAANMSDIQEREFRTFLNYLGRRIHYYCTELEKTEPIINTEELPCNYQENENLPEFKTLPSSSEETATASEEVSDLDGSLNSALAQFDEMLLRENEQIASQKSSQEQGGSSSGREEGSSAGSGDNGGTSERNGVKAESSQSISQQGAVRSGAGIGNQYSMTTQTKEQAAIYEDDDIVARQLREAAEKETDPEIKEKLWEEYRKYRKGVR